MARQHADEYQRIADSIRHAASTAGGPMGSPVGAGQDLEQAAELLSRISPECSGEAEEVEKITYRLRFEGSFAQDYKHFARQSPWASRVHGLADRLERLAT